MLKYIVYTGLSILLLNAAADAHAGSLTFQFTGTVYYSNLSQLSTELLGQLEVGHTVSGRFTIDESATQVGTYPSGGAVYLQTAKPTDFQLEDLTWPIDELLDGPVIQGGLSGTNAISFQTIDQSSKWFSFSGSRSGGVIKFQHFYVNFNTPNSGPYASASLSEAVEFLGTNPNGDLQLFGHESLVQAMITDVWLVPEPTTTTLLAIGAPILLAVARRRGRKRHA